MTVNDLLIFVLHIVDLALVANLVLLIMSSTAHLYQELKLLKTQ